MNSQLPKALIITIALIQGLLLTLLNRSVDQHLWPSTDPVWLVSLLTFTTAFPMLMFLSVTQRNVKSIVSYLLPFCLFISALGAYIGHQFKPIDVINNYTLVPLFTLSILIASFKMLVYTQQYIQFKNFNYASLFTLSWRNFILFAESGLFVLIFWGILHLGAALFAVINVTIFEELLSEDWVVIPVLNVALGFAIIIFRNITAKVDTIAIILQTLIKFLLPALTIVSLGFLMTLPFSGLDNLWMTGKGSFLVLWIQALTLFFVNAVYQSSTGERPYGRTLHLLVLIGVALLPIYSVIASYGIYTRIAQYGLTLERCYAVLVVVMLACFSVGYFVGIVIKRELWLQVLNRVNVVMGMVVLVTVLLVNSPILNFQAMSAKSQMTRLSNGEVTLDEFDYAYFSRELGRHGYLALQQLKANLTDTHPDKVILIDRFYASKSVLANNVQPLATFQQALSFWPSEHIFPQSLIEAIYQNKTKNSFISSDENSYYLLAVDLNDEIENEYVLIRENNYGSDAELWLLIDDRWQAIYMQLDNPNKHYFIQQWLDEQKVRTIQPQWRKLEIGDVTITISENALQSKQRKGCEQTGNPFKCND